MEHNAFFRINHMAIPLFRSLSLLVVLAASTSYIQADDWPQWLGPKRDSVWSEKGVMRTFPTGGPTVLWHTAIAPGFSGPAVADGCVFVTDRVLGKGAMNPIDPFDDKMLIPSSERIHCLDAKTGKEKWHRDYYCPYKISYPAGPRATPTVSGGKVYTVGAMGDLRCLDAAD